MTTKHKNKPSYRGLSLEEKANLINTVHAAGFRGPRAARKIGIASSCYYRWKEQTMQLQQLQSQPAQSQSPSEIEFKLREEIAHLKAQVEQLKKMNKSLSLCVIESTSFE